jgi:hypothetical protein
VLDIFQDIYKKFLFKIALLFVSLFVGILALFYADFDNVVVSIVLLFVLFLSAFLVVVKMIKDLHLRLDEDIEALSSYLKKVDAKEYDATIEIKNYLEFLELSLLLKNLVKRLVQRSKKGAKTKS